ncbi:type VI secretion system baseplate subunit TssK [Azospirillum sp. A1-3]|uniref:type VI secretion system baseplate subunit TssK n=1 Tax=Azospirillum sp. A1-3 TaxID=185874 RepID=UPI0020778908|nr:type VI secretion system baseplate subunit TssK [Azospirillum sp. A1-3]MCM8738883.1 type VI secretion system baseplate subunit TssK [Azospirillum sp. A1-3]
MSGDNKVVWSEGMFILPQHFQQADRYVEHLVRARVGNLRPFPWGVSRLEINRDLLTTGRFALIRCSGVLEDGTPFSIPEDAPPPPAIELPENIRDCMVFLTLPVAHPGAAEVEMGETAESVTRYCASEVEVADGVAGTGGRARLHVGRLRLRLALETDPRDDMICIGLARIVEVRPDRSVVLDDRYIPPCLNTAASSILIGFLDELQGLMHQRADMLAGRVSEAGVKGVAEFGDYLLLLALNRYEPLMAHLARLAALHPVDFYAAAVQIAGELATFTARSRRPLAFGVYRHDDLQATFAPVMTELRHALTTMIESSAIPLVLQQTKFGLWYAAMTDRTLLSTCNFVLAVRADVPAETLRRTFPGQVKIGPGEQIRDLITSASRGIQLRPLQVAPRQIPYHAGKVYFEFERHGPQWEAMRSSSGFAVHVAGDFPHIEMDLWAIREVTS